LPPTISDGSGFRLCGIGEPDCERFDAQLETKQWGGPPIDFGDKTAAERDAKPIDPPPVQRTPQVIL
jgi:hypothetical protein